MANNELKWSADEIADACVKAGLGILECHSLMVTLKATPPVATPAQAEPSDALELIAESWDGCLHDGADIGECLREEFSRIRGQQCGVSDAADRVRLNWIEDQSDFGPIEITLGKGTRPNTTATYLTYGADDGSRISSGPARHVRAAIDQCKNPDAAIQAQAGDAPKGGA